MMQFVYEWVGFLTVSCVSTLFVAGLLQHLRASFIGQRVEYKDQHVLVTGGSSGLGLAYAVLVARKGARVTIVARK